MPLYIIIGFDVACSTSKRKLIRPAHLARLKQLKQQGRLLLAGPMPVQHGKDEMAGSVIIAQFDDDEQLRQWVDDEPYLLEGIYSHVQTHPFLLALDGQNHNP